MSRPWSRGSEWHRWDPHLHTPGTLLNNQYGNAWDGFLTAIETASPSVGALGITDYCVLRGYQQFLEHRKAGRASNVGFVFPNVEFRLTINTKGGKGINVHLLFSPDDADHVEHIERLLGSFKFHYKDIDYPCMPMWLTKLGRAVDPTLKDDEAALRFGAEQFKLDWDTVVGAVKRDPWARENCLLAISAHSNDGFSGLPREGSFEAMREELKAQPHVIFSANPADRDFFLGQKPGFDRDFIETTYGGLKPCLHGSDAHKLEAVLNPVDKRYCWIRAELSFTGLKQTLLEPETRVEIAALPPPGPIESECIRRVEVSNAPWLSVAEIELNDGLVAIVGPKGSGKTALADIIARAAGADISDGASFLSKAHDFLGDSEAVLHWADGLISKGRLDTAADPDTRPFVRYLSQQFVERLCSAEGVSGELLDEIEAVVFQAIDMSERLGASNFDELRGLRLDQVARLRQVHLETIERFTALVAEEDSNKARLPGLQQKLAEHDTKIARDEKELARLLPADKKSEVEQLAAITIALEAKTASQQQLALQTRRLGELIHDYAVLREGWAREMTDLQERYFACGVKPLEWETLAPKYLDEKVEKDLFQRARERITTEFEAMRDGTRTKDEKVHATWSLKDLQDEKARLTSAIGVEKERAKKHADLSRRIMITRRERDTIAKELAHSNGSITRRQNAIASRRRAYASVFATLVQEEDVLNELYEPLKAQLANEVAAERKLELQTRRNVDIDTWVQQGEDLLDLRRSGPFQGHGALRRVILEGLGPAWKSGGADDVASAMESFLGKHMTELAKARREGVTFEHLGRWLFSTDHVSLEYGIRYEGVEIAHLSPGMRGIVLLMLYLAIDRWDVRPLLVDQPEENLDPHSVYQELVKYFRSAKRRRQVIIVTHNPNLVVNADADQVIVASAERSDSKALPTIRYESGGLEDQAIRHEVCRVLEGGERAFLEREQRYAIQRDLRLARKRR